MSTQDIPIFPADLMAILGIKHPNTLRLRIKEGKVPAPDVRLTQKSRYWHRATLVQAGLIAKDQPTPEPEGKSQSAHA